IRMRTNHLSLEQISLRGHWRFEEGGGSVAVDSALEGRHGNVSGALDRVSGRNGGGIDLSRSRLEILNTDFTVLPESGGAFSISCWLRADQLPMGRSGLMKCGLGTSNGWELTIEKEDATGTRLHFDGFSTGGTLDLFAPVPLREGTWSKLDLSYNGGIAEVYIDGRKVHEQNGAILA